MSTALREDQTGVFQSRRN